jgi:hypothetical protein
MILIFILAPSLRKELIWPEGGVATYRAIAITGLTALRVGKLIGVGHVNEFGVGQFPAPPTPRQRTLPNAPVLLGDDEVYVRKYEAVRAGGGSGGNGTLYVTNARVIFFAKAKGRGTQRESSLLQQTRLQDVTGVVAYVSYRISLGLMILIGIFALGLLVAIATKILLWVLIDAVVILVCVLLLAGGGSRRGGAGVTIHSASTETSPINFGSFAAKNGGFLRALVSPFTRLFRAYTAFDVAFGIPGADSEMIIAELGALILDMQQRGNDALERWGVGETASHLGEPERGTG